MKAIIFDMDGTMVNNMMFHHKAWQITMRKYGIDWDLEKIRQKVHGVNIELLERLFGDRFTMEDREKIAFEKEEEYRSIYKPKMKLIDGLDLFLDELAAKNIPLVIGSAAPPGNVNFVVDTLGLRDRFQHILHSESVTQGKPHPEIYLKLASLLDLPPEDCIVFEDSPTGAKAAANAKCPSVIITTTHSKQEFDGIDGIDRFIEDYKNVKLEDFI